MKIAEDQLRRMIREELMRENYREEDDSWASVLADPRTPEHVRDMIRNTPGLVPDEDEGGEFSLDPEKVARAQEESAFVRGETHGQARTRLGTNENLASQGASNMKITKVQLKQIVKEEFNAVYKEGFMDGLKGADRLIKSKFTGQEHDSAN